MPTSLSPNQVFDQMSVAASKQYGLNPSLLKAYLRYRTVVPGTSAEHLFEDPVSKVTLTFNAVTKSVVLIAPGSDGWPASILAEFRKTDRELNDALAAQNHLLSIVAKSQFFREVKPLLAAIQGPKKLFAMSAPAAIVTAVNFITNSLSLGSNESKKLMHALGDTDLNDIASLVLQAYNNSIINDVYEQIKNCSCFDHAKSVSLTHVEAVKANAPELPLLEESLRAAIEAIMEEVPGTSLTLVQSALHQSILGTH